MTVLDCHEKMSGYTYLGIVDHDEFLIPAGNRSIKQLLVCSYEPRHEKTCLRVSDQVRLNRPAQLQRPARVLKFWI